MKLKGVILRILILSAIIFGVFACTSCIFFGPKIDYEEPPDENEMQFKLNDGGDGYILSRVGINMVEVEIPAEYEGLPVVGIGSYAFTPYTKTGCSNYHRPVNPLQLIIPASVKYIKGDAFSQNIIKEVIYDGTLEEWLSIKIASTPFSEKTRFLVNGTEETTSLVIPESVKAIPNYAFYGLGTLKSVTFHGEVEEIGEYSFAQTGITSLELPDSVMVVHSYAFSKCEMLEEATLSANLSELPDNMFNYCTKLKTVNLKCGIETLGEYVFCGCESLENIDLSFSTLTQIPQYAFSRCSALGVIVIPESVNNIETDAFYYCVHLFEIYNLSDLDIRAGSEDNGGVALYAVAVYTDLSDERVPVETEDGYLFSKIDGKNYLLRYTGDELNLTLPESFNGENYAIKDYAFRNSDINSVNIPATVTGIGNEAFYECKALKRVYGADGVKIIGKSAFEGCLNLVSDIPLNVEEIGWSAYSGCTGLTSVIVPVGVRRIEGWTFNGCTSLTSVTISEGAETIESSAFRGCSAINSITFPESLKEIEYCAFEGAFSQADIVIPKNVECIGDYAFRYSGVTSVEFKGAVIIGNAAFYGLRQLTTVNFNEGLKTIEYDAFAKCESIEDLHFPSTIREFDVNSFSECTGLKKLTVAKNNPIYKSYNNCIIEKSTKTVLMGCLESVIPDDGSVTKIGDRAFMSCKFNTFNLPNGVTEIGERAFAHCGLNTFTVPDSITTIDEYAFYGCSTLETVYIGSGVKYFGYEMLAECGNLHSLYYNGTLSQFHAIKKESNHYLSSEQTITIYCKNDISIKYTQH